MRGPRFAAAFTISALLLASAASAQQTADTTPPRPPMGAIGTPMGRPMGMPMDMRMMHDSADARLDRLVATMNAAKGDRKIKAMAEVINELVAERKMMHEHMRAMMNSGGMPAHMGGDPGMMHRHGMGGPPIPDSTGR